LKLVPQQILEQFPSRVQPLGLNSRRGERVETEPGGSDQEMLTATHDPQECGIETVRYVPVSSVAFQPGNGLPGLHVRFRCEMVVPSAPGAPEFPFQFVVDF
jgi:hypothetical protein